MKDIVACMITVDRRLFGKENYLSTTLENLSRSGFFDSDRLAGFNLCNSRADNDWISDPHDFSVYKFGGHPFPARHVLYSQTKSLQANENAGYALEASGYFARDVNAKWVLFMEDDLDFCSDFLGSVGRYLDHCDNIDLFPDIPIVHSDRLEDNSYGFEYFRIVAFGCPYPQITEAFNDGRKYWLYNVADFYGTQCFAIRPHDAISLGRYLQLNPTGRNPNEYDLMIHEWMRAEHPDNKYFLATVPSFVEHIGRQSVCNVDKKEKETHQNPSWRGRDWSFVV